MVNVDVKKINESILTYKNVINNISVNDVFIERNFNELRKYWNNPNSVKLYRTLDSDTNHVKLLENDMDSQLKVYNFISNCYGKLGNKISFNNDNIAYIDQKLDIIINQFEDVLDYWGALGIEAGKVSWFPKISTIYNLRSDYLKVRDSFDDIKEAVDDKMRYIKNAENEIAKKVNNIKIENIVVNDFNVD